MINKFSLILYLHIQKSEQQAIIYFLNILMGIDEEPIPILVFISVE